MPTYEVLIRLPEKRLGDYRLEEMCLTVGVTAYGETDAKEKAQDLLMDWLDTARFYIDELSDED